MPFLNAGVGLLIPLEAVDEAAFDKHFNVNVKGKFFTLQKILPVFTENGSVLFTTAVGAYRGYPALSVYNVTVGANSGFVQNSLREESG